jgi:uncharacterized protein YndB with AHSA1/START domain
MITNELRLHLNRPVDQVFGYLVDSRNLTAWQSNLISIQLLTEGPLRVGTRFREVRRLGRRESEIQGEVTAFEPNKRFETKTITEPHVTVSYFFEPDNGGTRLHYKFVMHTSGFMRLLEPLIVGSVRKETRADLETLKRILERQEPVLVSKVAQTTGAM